MTHRVMVLGGKPARPKLLPGLFGFSVTPVPEKYCWYLMLLNAPWAVTLVHWGADPAPVEVEEAEAELMVELGTEAEVELAAELASELEAEGDADEIEVDIAVTVTVIVASTVISARIPDNILNFQGGWMATNRANYCS